MADALLYDDLDLFGREIDDPLAELEQDIVHMLLESYGSNPDVTDRSIGLEDALSGQIAPDLRHRIETKLQEDARIDAAEAVVSLIDASHVSIALRVQTNQSELGVTLVFDGAGNVVRA